MRGLHSMRPSHSEGKPAKDACAMLRPISAKAASNSAVPVHTGVTGVAAQLSSKASLAPQQHLHLLCQAGVRRKRRDCSMHPITTSHHSLLLRCLGIAGQLAQCKHETDQTKPSHANQLPSSMPTSHVLESPLTLQQEVNHNNHKGSCTTLHRNPAWWRHIASHAIALACEATSDSRENTTHCMVQALKAVYDARPGGQRVCCMHPMTIRSPCRATVGSTKSFSPLAECGHHMCTCHIACIRSNTFVFCV